MTSENILQYIDLVLFYLAPSFLVADLDFVLHMDIQFITTRKCPFKSTAIGRRILGGRGYFDWYLMYLTEISKINNCLTFFLLKYKLDKTIKIYIHLLITVDKPL